MDRRGGPWRCGAAWTALATVGALAACGESAPEAAGPTVTDSAGVRVVEYPGPLTVERTIRLSAEPLYRHGHGPDDYQFQFVAASRLQPDGSAVVYDPRNVEVVVIDPDGSLREVLARSGQGPDEVRGVVSITVLAQDSVLIEDDGNAKLMWLSEGEVTRTLSSAGNASLGRLIVRGVDASGRPLMVTGSYRSDHDMDWLPGYMARLDLETGRADTVATYDMAPRRLEPRDPFAAFGAAVVSGHRFVSARGDLPEVTWRDPDGQVRQVVRWSPLPTYPTEADWERFAASQRETLPRINPQMSREQAQQFAERQLQGYAVRSENPMPLFALVEGDDRGGVWLSGYMRASTFPEFDHYSVFSPDGEWLGRVEMPPRFRILDVAHGLVLGVQRDELDVLGIAVYEILTEGGGS